MATKKGTRRPAKKRPAPRRPERQQPESLRLRSLAVSLTVNDLVRSLAWYRDVLRFTVGERWQDGGQLRGVQLKAGSCDLMLTFILNPLRPGDNYAVSDFDVRHHRRGARRLGLERHLPLELAEAARLRDVQLFGRLRRRPVGDQLERAE